MFGFNSTLDSSVQPVNKQVTIVIDKSGNYFLEEEYFDELPTKNLSDKFKVGRLREKSTRKPRRLPNDKAVLGPRNTPDNFDGFLGIDGPVEDVFEDPADPYDNGSRIITEDDGFEDFYLNQPDQDD